MLGAQMEIPAERYYSVTVLINIASASILCFAAVCAASAQSPAAEPRFEVASVHLDQAIADRGHVATVTFSGARVTIDGFALKDIVAKAYRTETYQGCNSIRQLGGETVTKQVSVGGPNGPTRFEITSDGDVREEYLKMTMQQLARRMSIPCDVSCLNLPVIDRTGIAGAWDFAIDRSCSASNCDTYASALEKIGLKLEKTAAVVERLVIDRIDKVPTEN